MGTKIGSIVLDCFEFEKTVTFWQEALHYRPRGSISNGWGVLIDPEGKGPNISFNQRDHKKKTRDWKHFDLYTDDQKSEVARLIKIGAKEYPWRYPESADYVVLEDPDGNLFCVVQK
ncbi:glyoxalase [Spirochaetia bacterium]|nr:glyoxalase [Spirochaetia bacterium]